MHTRHEALFRWLMARFPRTRLYGLYHHGDRSYFQWMARGQALVEDVLPVLDAAITPRDRRPGRRAACRDARALRGLHRPRGAPRALAAGAGDDPA